MSGYGFEGRLDHPRLDDQSSCLVLAQNMEAEMDIAELIKTAAIGSERRHAQNDTCAPFAAALHDVLVENGLTPKLVVAGHLSFSSRNTWYHQVVEQDGVFYDSLGEFSTEIIRKRLKIHPSVKFELEFKPDQRDGCYDEEDYAELYMFLVKAFRKAALKLHALRTDNEATPPLDDAVCPRM